MRIKESLKLTAESMLKAGEYGWKVAEVTGLSLSTVNKIRKEVMKQGYEHVFHPRGGLTCNWGR